MSAAIEYQVGDVVEWTGSINFGRETVQWCGRVVKLGYGEPYYDDPPRYSADGYMLEAGRHPAVEVEPVYPQHGIIEAPDPAHRRPIIVAIQNLKPYIHPCPPCPDCGHRHRLSLCGLCDCQNTEWR